MHGRLMQSGETRSQFDRTSAAATAGVQWVLTPTRVYCLRFSDVNCASFTGRKLRPIRYYMQFRSLTWLGIAF